MMERTVRRKERSTSFWEEGFREPRRPGRGEGEISLVGIQKDIMLRNLDLKTDQHSYSA